MPRSPTEFSSQLRSTATRCASTSAGRARTIPSTTSTTRPRSSSRSRRVLLRLSAGWSTANDLGGSGRQECLPHSARAVQAAAVAADEDDAHAAALGDVDYLLLRGASEN